MSDEQIDNSLLDYDYEYLPDGFLFDKQNTVQWTTRANAKYWTCRNKRHSEVWEYSHTIAGSNEHGWEIEWR